MSRRMKMYTVVLVLGIALLFAFASTALSSDPWCPPQEQTLAGTCAGPEGDASDSSTHTTKSIEIHPKP